MNIKIQFDEKQLLNATKKEPMIALQEINNAIKKSALKIQSLSQRSAPADTGALRQSITSRFEPLRGIVQAGAKYAIYVHQGTRPHDIFPVRKRALANVRKGQFFGKHVKHPGTKANPFMMRSVTQAMPQITNYFRQALSNILNRI
jgi:hypothetical protein